MNASAATKLTLQRGQGRYLTTVSKGLKYTWKSSNTKVLTVNRYGFVKPLKEGTVTVTGIKSKKKYIWKITVTDEKIQSKRKIRSLPAGTVVDKKDLDFSMQSSYFKSYKIKKNGVVYNRILNKSYDPNGRVALSDLRYLKVLHYNWDHKIQVGEIIVNKAIADDILKIFKELFDYEYEIESMYLIDHTKIWKGNGDRSDSYSCSVNNTSSFCYRSITGGGKLSDHAYGRAIDFNPKPNPYCYRKNGEWTCARAVERIYINRSKNYKGMIKTSDFAYKVFTKYGFQWGGAWNSIKDYQHFYK